MKHERKQDGSETQRRKFPRLSFTASAEVTDLASQQHFSLRTTDVGTGGCFLDALLPFPVGSRVSVNLRHDLADFQAEGIVTYSQTALGMGIAFEELSSEQQLSLLRFIG
jgi:hypothetical protein